MKVCNKEPVIAFLKKKLLTWFSTSFMLNSYNNAIN